MQIELVRTTTRDGYRLHGSFQTGGRAGYKHSIMDAVCFVHGTGGNFYSSTLFDQLADRFREIGVAVMRVNTRGHDGVSTATTEQGGRRLGAAYETLDDCRHDIAAWLEELARRGYERLGLLGHSFGAVKAVCALSRERLPVKRLICLSPPRLSYELFCQSDRSEEFLAAFGRAQACMDRGEPETLLDVQFPLPYLISAAGFIEKYGPEERCDYTRMLSDLSCPALLTFGSAEMESHIAFRNIPELLRNKLRDRVNVTTKVIDGADHFYAGQRDALAGAIEEWLESTGNAASLGQANEPN